MRPPTDDIVLMQSGVLLVGGNSQYEVTFDLSRLAHHNQSIVGVPQGTREQLKELVQLYAVKQVRIIRII